MINHLHAWFFPDPETVRQEIRIKDGHLALMAGYHVKSSVYLNLLPVHIPECRSYTVEYRLSPAGEFAASRDKYGNIWVRSSLISGHRFRVCWLHPSFVGKKFDRYILMIDRKPVFYRAGVGYRSAA